MYCSVRPLPPLFLSELVHSLGASFSFLSFYFFLTLFHVHPQALPFCENIKLEITSPFELCGTLKSRHGALRHHRIALYVLSRLYFPLCLSAHCRVGVYLFVSLPLSDSSILLPLSHYFENGRNRFPLKVFNFAFCSLLLQHFRTFLDWHHPVTVLSAPKSLVTAPVTSLCVVLSLSGRRLLCRSLELFLTVYTR